MKNKLYASKQVLIFFQLLMLSVVIAAALTIQPNQYALGWQLFAVLVLIALVQSPNRLFLRTLLLSVAAFITLRYLAFRVSYTLYFDDYISFSLALILFLAECYASGIHFLGLFVNLSPKQRPIPPLPQKLPSIDVFIPTYNEDISVALTTAMACKNFNYPAELVNIYILDDGCRLTRINTQELQPTLLQRHKELRQKAIEAGVMYLTREDGEQAKAGMLNAALLGKAFSSIEQGEDGVWRAGERVKTDGELILILDCDHIPTRDMPAMIAGHFSNPKVFLVQTPHFMINPDPVRKDLDDEKDLPCEGWLFYQNTQRGLDHWNAAFFCGSAAFLRRTMLEETNGLCGETITEDCETALTLHSKGYKSVYVNTPLVAGLAPESLVDMIKQRQRWCQGMLQIMLLKNPLFLPGLTIAQRICYMNNCLFWLFPLPRIIFLIAPLMFLLFKVNIYNTSIEQVLAFAAPHIAASILVSAIIHGKLRPFLYSEVLETVQSFFLIPAIISVLLAPRKPIFMTTRKGVTLEKDSLSPLAWPFFLLAFLSILGFAFGLKTWLANPLLHQTLYITGFWNAYNFIIIVCCIGAVWERKQRRKSHRVRTDEPVTLDGIAGTLNDLSASGVAITMEKGDFYPGQECVFNAPLLTTKIIIRHVKDNKITGTFAEEADAQSIIGFVYGDYHRWQRTIDSVLLHRGGYLRQSLYLLGAGFRSSIQAFAGAIRKIAVLFLVAASFTILPSQTAQAEEFTSTLSSLILEENFVVAAAKGELRIPFYLSPRANVESVTLRVVYSRSGLFPKGQQPISVVIDEQKIEEKRASVDAGSGMLAVTFDLPKEKLIPGNRVVLLQIIQSLPKLGTTSPDKIKQLANEGDFWTNIDLTRSTISITQTQRELTVEERSDFHFLFNEQSSFPKSINIVLPDPNEMMTLRAVKVVQHIALLLEERPLQITASSNINPGKDNIIISDNAETILSTAPDNPFHVVLTEADIPDYTPAKRYVLGINTTQTFENLGFDTTTFRPQSSPQASRFLIPTPTYLNPNRFLIVSLDLAYSSGLHESSYLEVGVNNEILTWINLTDPNGQQQNNHTVSVPVTLLKKGFNTLTVRPHLIPASGNRWDDGEEDLFATVFNTSSLTLPDTGIYVKIPELATIFTDSYPFIGDGICYLPDPDYDKTAAFLNLGALIAQQRGTQGQNVSLSFTPWQPGARDAIVISIDPDLPPESILLKADIIPNTTGKVRLSLKARTSEDLLKGVYALWNHQAQQKIHGTEALFNYVTRNVKTAEGETIIISDIGPFSELAYYVNNYPMAAKAVFALLLVLFAFVGYRIATNRNE